MPRRGNRTLLGDNSGMSSVIRSGFLGELKNNNNSNFLLCKTGLLKPNEKDFFYDRSLFSSGEQLRSPVHLCVCMFIHDLGN